MSDKKEVVERDARLQRLPIMPYMMPYVVVVRGNGMVHLSSNIGKDPKTRKPAEGDVKDSTNIHQGYTDLSTENNHGHHHWRIKGLYISCQKHH